MATPNIVNVATINAKNAAAKLTGTSRTEAVDVPDDKVAKIKEAISSGKYPLDLDKLSDALMQANREMKS